MMSYSEKTQNYIFFYHLFLQIIKMKNSSFNSIFLLLFCQFVFANNFNTFIFRKYEIVEVYEINILSFSWISMNSCFRRYISPWNFEKKFRKVEWIFLSLQEFVWIQFILQI